MWLLEGRERKREVRRQNLFFNDKEEMSTPLKSSVYMHTQLLCMCMSTLAYMYVHTIQGIRVCVSTFVFEC